MSYDVDITLYIMLHTADWGSQAPPLLSSSTDWSEAGGRRGRDHADDETEQVKGDKLLTSSGFNPICPPSHC